MMTSNEFMKSRTEWICRAIVTELPARPADIEAEPFCRIWIFHEYIIVDRPVVRFTEAKFKYLQMPNDNIQGYLFRVEDSRPRRTRAKTGNIKFFGNNATITEKNAVIRLKLLFNRAISYVDSPLVCLNDCKDNNGGRYAGRFFNGYLCLLHRTQNNRLEYKRTMNMRAAGTLYLYNDTVRTFMDANIRPNSDFSDEISVLQWELK